MKTLDRVVDEGVFCRYLAGCDLDNRQQQLIHNFLKTTADPGQFMANVISLRMEQHKIDYALDALHLAARRFNAGK